MQEGFFIKKLRITGTNKKPAEIDFTQGLNVVAGASNTGKSYIYQCIDFMLGGKTPPKYIIESEGYEWIQLVIQAYEGENYTLRRNIVGNKFFIKKGDVDSVEIETEYAEKFSATNSQNISTFLLEMCGLKDIQLKQNEQNKKANLSFRDVIRLCLVDEKNILSEISPALSGESTTRTKEKSLFYYFLTQTDASKFVEVEDPRTLKSKISGKIEFVKDTIKRLQAKLDEFKEVEIETLKVQIKQQYDSLSLEYNNTIIKINELQNIRNNLVTNLERLKTKILFKSELIERFLLLEKHYKSDLQRLEFIDEGNYLLQQLNSVSCPLCGSEITENHYEHIKQFQKNNDKLETSINAEAEKLKLKVSELTDTLNNLKTESEKQNKKIDVLTGKIQVIENELTLRLTPVNQTLRTQLNTLTNREKELERYTSLKNEIATYAGHLNTLEAQLHSRLQQNENATYVNDTAFTEFSKAIEIVLTAWEYPNLTSLFFNNSSSEFDIRINNLPRKSNGKGYRAIITLLF